MNGVVVVVVVVAWGALALVVWTALRDLREESRRERGVRTVRRR